MYDYFSDCLVSAPPFAVHFSEELCEIPEITGGKGSSLGKLTQLSKQYQNVRIKNILCKRDINIEGTSQTWGTFFNKNDFLFIYNYFFIYNHFF